MIKRVLIFSLAYYPNLVGGAEVAIKEITDRMGSGIEFDMITARFDKGLPAKEKIGNINVYRVGFGGNSPTAEELIKFPFNIYKYLFPFFAYTRAVELNGEKKYDIVWSMMANYAGFGALFFKIFHPKIKYLLTLQEGDPIEYIKGRVGILFPVFKKIFTSADRIQVISNYLAGFAKDMGYRGEIDVIPNGVDVEKFTKKYSEEEMPKLKTSDKDKIIITTSRLVKKNAVDDVIKALSYLPENYKFMIVGDGPDLKKLKELADLGNVSDRVMFKGHIDHKELPKYLKASDIFIRPSLSEGMGNSFIEAMAAEIPVIATPVGGIVDFLFDPEKNKDTDPTGLFCNVGDPKDIADKILKIVSNDSLRIKMIENAKKIAIEKYDWNKIAGDMKKLFGKL